MEGHLRPVNTVACTLLDGKPVAVTGSDGAQVWDLASGRPIGEPLNGHDSVVVAVACTVLDGKPVAVTGSMDQTARVWDLASGHTIGKPLTGHRGHVVAVACTVLDGKPIAVTGSKDGTARVWDLRARELLQTFIAPTLQSAAFTHDRRLVVALGCDVAVLRRSVDQT
jgi:WD40 repeat protein